MISILHLSVFRQAWSTYFDERNIRVIFYSALLSAPSTKKTTTNVEDANDAESIDDTEQVLEDIKRNQLSHNDDNLEIAKSPSKLNRFDGLQLEDDNEEKEQSEININNEEGSSNEDEEEEEEEEEEEDEEDNDEDVVEQIREDILAYGQLEETKKKNLPLIVNREELIYLLKSLYPHKKTVRENILTIGMVKKSNESFSQKKIFFCFLQVGYPNVGKSSTINSLLQYKKVSVSATPGKTKHFQVNY